MSKPLQEIIDNYLKYQENIKSFSPLTLKAYRLDLEQAYVGKLNFVFKYDQIWGLSRDSLNRWGHLSPASRNRKIATLKSFFGWLFEQNYTEVDHSHQLICPKVPKKIPHFISVDEVITILKDTNQRLANVTDAKNKAKLLSQKTLFILLYGCGLRISEACNLKWKDIHLFERKILILGKGSKERYAILPEFCFLHLNEMHKNSNKDIFVFGAESMNPRKGFELIRQLGMQAGLISSLHPHALRHSYATHLLASGANLRTLQTLLGHDSLQATEKYTHLSVDHIARLVERTHPLSKLKLSS